MNKITKGLAVVIALAFPMMAQAAATPGAGIYATKHDFASFAGDSSIFASTQLYLGQFSTSSPNSVGVCGYCHTPHGAISTVLLWTHTLSGNTFTWDEATTAGGTPYASINPTYKGPSVRCLSCHDGTVAIGNISNHFDAWYTNTFKVGVNGSTTYRIASNSGAMNGNHPVAMPYPFGQVANTYNTKTTGANVVLTDFVGDPEGTNGTNIKLYNQTGTATPVADGYGTISGMECSSCHDPHNRQSVDVMFLRGKISGSTAAGGYICLQCHIK